MKTLSKNQVNQLKSLLISEGMTTSEVDSQLNNIDSILFTRLPASSLLPQNRTTETCKQTHIHFTGESMSFFYPQSILNNPPLELSTDSRQPLTLSKSNLISLYTSNSDNIPSYINNSPEELLSSFTVKKLGHHYSQVQISKIRYDDPTFLNLRRALYENDILVFVKKVNCDDYFTFAIKSNVFLSLNLSTGLYYNLHTHNNNTNLSNNSNVPHSLREVTPENIAQFNLNEDMPKSSPFDLTTGINTRLNRTERHQNIVRLIAQILSHFEYRLFENPMDCLATKINNPTLLFEVKTLDGSTSDERSQVMKASAQLLYYEHFDCTNIPIDQLNKIAFFERKISDEHISYLHSLNINVYWLDENNHIIQAQ